MHGHFHTGKHPRGRIRLNRRVAKTVNSRPRQARVVRALVRNRPGEVSGPIGGFAASGRAPGLEMPAGQRNPIEFFSGGLERTVALLGPSRIGDRRLSGLVWSPKVASLLPDADTLLAAEGGQNVRVSGGASPSVEAGQRRACPLGQSERAAWLRLNTPGSVSRTDPVHLRPTTRQRSRIGIVALNAEIAGYRPTTQVGTGAGSKIYRAVELATGKMVAIKHVVRESADDERFLIQAENEHNVCSRLDHPNLRRCYSIHKIRKRLQVRELVVVMEWVDGLNIEKARPNRLNTFIALFQKVAMGLDAMHRAGYVHTDIKPTNVMLAQGGMVKIIDFGQSCPLHHRKERIQGTPDYIAPEQVRRMSLDQRTDVFNLGATMYWVLTSEKYPTAIRGVDSRGGISLISADKPLAPIELNEKIPLALSKLVMECCRDKPDDRPVDMKQVMARLAVVKKLWRRHRETLRAQRGSATSSSAGGTNADSESDL